MSVGQSNVRLDSSGELVAEMNAQTCEITREKQRDRLRDEAIERRERGIDDETDGRIPGGEGKPTCYAISEAIATAIGKPGLAERIHLLFSVGDSAEVGHIAYAAWREKARG